MELFANEFQDYPPSDANDVAGLPYCGSMKLAEAVMGQDLLGYHSRSAFRADGLDPCSLAPLYPANPSRDNLGARRGPYLQPESATAYRLADIYDGLYGTVDDICNFEWRYRQGGDAGLAQK